MKNIFAAALFFCLTLSSCKKDYACVCTNSGATTGKETTTITDTKKNAQEKCDQGDSSGNGFVRQCEIDGTK